MIIEIYTTFYIEVKLVIFNNDLYNSSYIFALVVHQRASLKFGDFSDFKRLIIC
jgi:hypothetical protein